MLPDIHYKSQREVDNDWRPEGNEGRINEKQPDARRCHAQLFPHMRAHTKRIALKKMLDPRCCFTHITILIMFFDVFIFV